MLSVQEIIQLSSIVDSCNPFPSSTFSNVNGDLNFLITCFLKKSLVLCFSIVFSKLGNQPSAFCLYRHMPAQCDWSCDMHLQALVVSEIISETFV